MPQEFIEPTETRTFDELRRDIEQGLRTLSLAIERTKQSGVDEQAQWAVRRVKTGLDKLRKAPNGDSVVVNRLTAEAAQLENELKRAERTWLLTNAQQQQQQQQQQNQQQHSLMAFGRQVYDEDEARARLLRANQVLGQSDRIVDDIEGAVVDSHRVGVSTLSALHLQGEELVEIQRNVTDTGSSAKSAGVVLRRMAERAFYNRLFLWTVIITLIIMNIMFLWFGFIKK